MITTPPPPEVHTPNAPLHGPLLDPPHISNRKSDRIAGRQKRADRTPSPDCNAASFDSEGPGELKRTPKQRRQPTTSFLSSSTRASSRPISHDNNTHISPPSSPLGADSLMMHKNRSARSKAKESGASSTQLGLPTPARTPRKQVLLNNNSEAARVLFPAQDDHKRQAAATPSRQQMDETMFPTPVSKKRGKRTRKNVGFRLDNELQFDADGRGGDIEIYTDSREQRPEVDESSENPFYVGPGEPKKRYPKRKVKPQQAKKVETGLEMLKNDRGYLAVGRGRRFWKDISDPNKLPESPTLKAEAGDSSCETNLTSDQLDDDNIDVERSENADVSRKLRPRRLFAEELGPSDSGEDLDLELQPDEDDAEEAATDIEEPEKQHINGEEASDLYTMPAQKHHRHTGVGKKSGDLPVSPFDSWPRRKPSRTRSSGGDTKVPAIGEVGAAAATIRAPAAPAKREGEPLVPASASKRMRESHH